jgi:peptide/nickel transport system substrate-binding protein
MNRKSLTIIFSLLMVAVMVLGACAPTAQPTEEAGVPEQTVAEPEGQANSEEPAAPSTDRKGAWVDEIIFTSIDEVANAVAQIQADQLDLYAYLAQDPDTFEIVKSDPNLAYSLSYGSWDSILFNTAEFNNGKLNPFSNPKIREATNWLVDRNYLVQEAVGGLGTPRFISQLNTFPDYALYADLIRPMESKYAYNFDKGEQIIATEMEAMGAVKNGDGKWTYNGEPVVIIGLIRSEDERAFHGNYFCDQLEAIGFTCDRQVRTRTELSPIWVQGVPENGEFHFYTAGNYWGQLLRDEGGIYFESFCPDKAYSTTEEAFVCVPELHDAAEKLYVNNFASMAERRELFATVIPLSIQSSTYMNLIHPFQFAPRKADLIVASDLSAGVGGSTLWPYTVRWAGKEGGTVRSANSGILTGPWNPIAGHNWNQELTLINTTQEAGAFADPYTGLYWPQRIEKATVKVVEGTPINKTLDWVSLETAQQIDVPADAWADWDAESQTFITAAEKYPEGATAKAVVTVYYPNELWDIVKYHDGSPLSMADFVLNMIIQFEHCDENSPVYDESLVGSCDAFKSIFKGVRIVSTEPLVIETYADAVSLDAEVTVGQISGSEPGYSYTWWPVAYTGSLAWHTYVPAYLAEAAQELAFSGSKSTSLEIEWTNYIAGPALEIMKKYLDQAQAETYIPFAPTLGAYITADDAAARYENLQTWYADHNHFWVGTGAFYIDEVNAVEGSVVAKRFEDFPDPSDKWSRFGEPMLAVVDVLGPGEVSQSADASFDAFISFKDAPYPQAEINSVSYLVYDTEGLLVLNGKAEPITEGQYAATLTAAQLAQLPTGSAKIEFVVASKAVAIPTFAGFEFVVSP